VEHSIPWSLGGTHHLNNLYAACIPAIAGKGLYNENGESLEWPHESPIVSRAQKRNPDEQPLGCGLTGLLFGARFGPGGALVCGIIGAVIGDAIKVK